MTRHVRRRRSRPITAEKLSEIVERADIRQDEREEAGPKALDVPLEQVWPEAVNRTGNVGERMT